MSLQEQQQPIHDFFDHVRESGKSLEEYFDTLDKQDRSSFLQHVFDLRSFFNKREGDSPAKQLRFSLEHKKLFSAAQRSFLISPYVISSDSYTLNPDLDRNDFFDDLEEYYQEYWAQSAPIDELIERMYIDGVIARAADLKPHHMRQLLYLNYYKSNEDIAGSKPEFGTFLHLAVKKCPAEFIGVFLRNTPKTALLQYLTLRNEKGETARDIAPRPIKELIDFYSNVGFPAFTGNGALPEVDTHTTSIHRSVDQSIINLLLIYWEERLDITLEDNGRIAKFERNDYFNQWVEIRLAVVMAKVQKVSSYSDDGLYLYLKPLLDPKITAIHPTYSADNDELKRIILAYRFQLGKALSFIKNVTSKDHFGTQYNVNTIAHNTCGLSLREILALTSTAAMDKLLIPSVDTADNEEDVTRAIFMNLVHSLYSAMRGYNDDIPEAQIYDYAAEDLNICVGGAINQLISPINGLVKGVEIKVITRELVIAKLHSVINDVIADWIDSTDLPNYQIQLWLNEWAKTDKLPSPLRRQLKAKVLHKINISESGEQTIKQTFQDDFPHLETNELVSAFNSVRISRQNTKLIRSTTQDDVNALLDECSKDHEKLPLFITNSNGGIEVFYSFCWNMSDETRAKIFSSALPLTQQYLVINGKLKHIFEIIDYTLFGKEDVQTILFNSVMRGLSDTILCGMLDYVNNIECESDSSNQHTPLIYTILSTPNSRWLDVVKLLLTKGANVNAIDAFGFSPLLHSLERINSGLGYQEAFRLLIDNGADVTIVGNNGFNALTNALCFAPEHCMLDICAEIISLDPAQKINDFQLKRVERILEQRGTTPINLKDRVISLNDYDLASPKARACYKAGASFAALKTLKESNPEVFNYIFSDTMIACFSTGVLSFVDTEEKTWRELKDLTQEKMGSLQRLPGLFALRHSAQSKLDHIGDVLASTFLSHGTSTSTDSHVSPFIDFNLDGGLSMIHGMAPGIGRDWGQNTL